jgi:putative ABC transport system ATP-binding protein
MLEIKSLHQTFNPGDVNQVHALRGIDLHVAKNQFVTIIGSNGAGKSTLFNAVAGVFPITKGQIMIDGVDVTTWKEHQRGALIGRVFQDPLLGTASQGTIAQNLTLALLRGQQHRLRTGVTSERRELFQDVLAPLGLGLETRLDSRVALLSGGQRQALTMLIATITKPKILLLDEHTASLDPATAEKILDQTRQIVSNQNLTTLMVTHNMQHALNFGDRILMMDSGQIVLDLSAEEKNGLVVQDLIDMFREVQHKRILDDKLLLSTS